MGTEPLIKGMEEVSVDQDIPKGITIKLIPNSELRGPPFPWEKLI